MPTKLGAVATAVPLDEDTITYTQVSTPPGRTRKATVEDWREKFVQKVPYVTFPANTDYYEAPAAVAAGGVNDFIVAIWLRPGNEGLTAAVNFNIAGAPGAWVVDWNFGGIRAGFYDSAAVLTGATNFGTASLWGYNLPSTGERDALLILRVTDGATTPEITLRVNGTQVANATAANAGTPDPASADTRIGGLGSGTVPDVGVEGLAYLSGTATEAELVAFEDACMIAGHIVNAGPAWTNVWSHAIATPGATWTDDAGTDDLTRGGTPGAASRKLRLA